MKSVRFDRIGSGYIHAFANCPRILSGLLLITTLSALPLRGQTSAQPQQPPSAPAQTQITPEHSAPPTPLRDLIQEAEHNSPVIAASIHAWQAATNVPRQVSALPETQVTLQQFSVGSPRPFAGYTNSDFAYIGIGAAQELPPPATNRIIDFGGAYQRAPLTFIRALSALHGQIVPRPSRQSRALDREISWGRIFGAHSNLPI
jgi:hypothetical protein